MIWNNGVLVTPGRADKRDNQICGMRVWPPERSKLSAFCYLGGDPDLDSGQKVLYLGAASGTTVSYLADYVEVVYAVEFAPDPAEKLVKMAESRAGIIPFFADARHPEEYALFIEPVDLICQDISQRDQAGILVENLRFLRPGGRVILMLKLRSISSVKTPEEITGDTEKILSESGLSDLFHCSLAPYHPHHVVITGLFRKND